MLGVEEVEVHHEAGEALAIEEAEAEAVEFQEEAASVVGEGVEARTQISRSHEAVGHTDHRCENDIWRYRGLVGLAVHSRYPT